MHKFDIHEACQHDEFGMHALPYGVFSVEGRDPRVCVRLGYHAIDLFSLFEDPIFDSTSLNQFMASGRHGWSAVRARIQDMLSSPSAHQRVGNASCPLSRVRMHMPVDIADYVDFYASEHHATNAARILRPGTPELAPNWKRMPVGYHGRSGTLQPSGTLVRRPRGQCQISPGQAVFGPTAKLDIEAELAFVVGTGTQLGSSVAIDAFEDHVFGVTLLNDWSARDIQQWEYVPLGPHLGKSFCTSISNWILPLEALAAAKLPASEQYPKPDEYLIGSGVRHTYDVSLEVWINETLITRPNFRSMYWTPAQMLAHLTINGANLRTGDIFASGTISGPNKQELGCLLELTNDGELPFVLNDGTSRGYLRDGDTVVIRATLPTHNGAHIGFGEVRGTITPSYTDQN